MSVFLSKQSFSLCPLFYYESPEHFPAGYLKQKEDKKNEKIIKKNKRKNKKRTET